MWLTLRCCCGAGSLDETNRHLTAVTSERASLAEQLAESASERDYQSQHLSRAEARSAELSAQLDSVSQQLRSSEDHYTEVNRELEVLQEKQLQQLSDSEGVVAELTGKLQETQAAHARLESEYELLTQQTSAQGASASPDSPESAQRKAQALLEELEDYRYAVQQAS